MAHRLRAHLGHLLKLKESNRKRRGVCIVEADLNDADLLRKLFDIVPFTYILYLAAQAGVRYAMLNPLSYVSSNIAGHCLGFLQLSLRPQHVPFSDLDRTDRRDILYAATKKASEEIAHTYNHIYGLSLTGPRFFTVYGPRGRPDMAYFFTKDII